MSRTTANLKAVGLQFALSFHKRMLSPLLYAGFSGACRFQPSCSEYAAIALHHHGLRRGGWLALTRFLRCHPGCTGGFDPVPGTWPLSEAGQSSEVGQSYEARARPAAPHSRLAPFTIGTEEEPKLMGLPPTAHNCRS